MYQIGDVVMDVSTRQLAKVVKVLADGVALKFIDGVIRVRYFYQVEPKICSYEPNVEPQTSQDDLLTLQHLAVEMNDKEWFEELSQRLEAAVSG